MECQMTPSSPTAQPSRSSTNWTAVRAASSKWRGCGGRGGGGGAPPLRVAGVVGPVEQEQLAVGREQQGLGAAAVADRPRPAVLAPVVGVAPGGDEIDQDRLRLGRPGPAVAEVHVDAG